MNVEGVIIAISGAVLGIGLGALILITYSRWKDKNK